MSHKIAQKRQRECLNLGHRPSTTATAWLILVGRRSGMAHQSLVQQRKGNVTLTEVQLWHSCPERGQSRL